MDKETILDNAFTYDDNIYGKQIEIKPASEPQIGIDTANDLIYSLAENSTSSSADINTLQSFTAVSRNRNELYDTIDYMSQDTTLASILETYAEDATETNDAGDIVWCESDDPNVAKYVSYLLSALNVNKNVFKWVYSLCKYGDVYLRLYRESEIEDKFFSRKTKTHKNNLKAHKNNLNEDVNVVAYSKNDRYIHYLEQAENPAQVFELTRFGKTAGYVKTNVKADPVQSDSIAGMNIFGSNRYKFNSNSSDVTLFPATEWVHGSLEDDSSRDPETVELFTDNDDESVSYKVKRGQSLLYDSYKTWRELMLLESSVLLNRVTQSSIVRVIGVEVGDMPKENVQPHLMNIKQLIEQRTALDVGKRMSDYTNPGPIVNNVYIPTRNNQNVLSTQQIGGDVNVGELVDLEYYEDKLFGGLRVPKQYFGRTDDSSGFSGGESLALISSRYAKMIKRIQNVTLQMLTDAINLILIDTDNEAYINKFTLRMLSPTTQEEVDRRENLSSKVGLITDIMNSLSEIEDATIKLKILKSLLSDTLTNTEVVSLIQEQIDQMEQAAESSMEEDTFSEDDEELSDLFADDTGSGEDTSFDFSDSSFDLSGESSDSQSSAESSEDVLPTPADLGIGDVSDATNPELQ